MIINLILLNVLIIFLSTNNLNANVYTVKNIQIKEPYDLNFKKKKVIEKAFISAFEILVSKKVSSKDLNISKTTNINLIKPMIDSFLISNEKFKDNYYSAEFEVFFNKKKNFKLFKFSKYCIINTKRQAGFIYTNFCKFVDR